MSSEYTPTTNQVRQAWMLCKVPRIGSNYGGTGLKHEFDRWLEAHDRQVAAKALRDAADGIRYTHAEHVKVTAGWDARKAWLRARAASIASGEVESHG